MSALAQEIGPDTDAAAAAVEMLDVLIIGAGVSGIGMACTLAIECPGKTYRILERRARLGGTWDLFNYPGVRSDSDMLTYGYRFRPWTDPKILADAGTIRRYLAETAREYGVDERIRYGVKVARADWSSAHQCWVVEASDEDGGRPFALHARQLVMCTGYYNHDAGHLPEFPGIERYTGRLVHPQHWPQDLAVSGRDVVVVGSGATAVTLVPALAEQGARVTMLQRSPSYVLSVPSTDPLTAALDRVLPRRWSYAMARRRNTTIARWLYTASRRWPARMRALLLGLARRQLGKNVDMAHFTPSYQPWDQRLCIVPDADLFRAIRSGQAAIATDRIAGFEGRDVLLASGARLAADVLVSATGLQMMAFGAVQVSGDGEPYAPQRHMLYKGVLMEDLPNFAWIVGYTNLSWTLKADIAATYICRLIRHLDAHGLAVACPHDDAGNRCEDEGVMSNLNAGYVVRAKDAMPRQGARPPWRVTHHYPSDRAALLDAPIDDGVLRFEPPRAGAVAARAAAL